MNADTRELQFLYRISKIYTKSFFSEDISEKELDDLLQEENGVGVNISTQLTIRKDYHELFITINSSYFTIDDEKKLIEHSGNTHFIIENIDAVFNEEKNQYDLPDGFLIQLFGIAYSHSRALLSEALAATVFKEKIFLPVVNPKIFVENQKKAQAQE